MSVEVRMIVGGLGPAERVEPGGAGAVVVFDGVVRPTEDGDGIRALLYEAYQPMADVQLRELANETLRVHGLLGVRVEHSVGRVAVGETSFRLTIRAAHRKEALAAMDAFIDRMKRDVPIWKQVERG